MEKNLLKKFGVYDKYTFNLTEKELDHVMFGLHHLWLIYMSSNDKRLQKMSNEIDSLISKLIETEKDG